MGEHDQQEAKDFLAKFNGDVEAAIAALMHVAPQQLQASEKQTVYTPKQSNRDFSGQPDVVQLQAVSKTYKLGSNKVEALNQVDVVIKQGEFVAITGTSGSGKSTMLHMIGGLDKPSSGAVIVDGHDIKKLSDAKLSDFRNKTIGFVFQFFYLQPFLTLQSNIELPAIFARAPRQQRRTNSGELAAAVGLAERVKHLPKELSGGQMQRAAIARALLNKPKILLADEPTGNLDQENSAAIIELFKDVRDKYNTTVVIVTHDQHIAEQADRVIVMRDGKVVQA